MAFFNARCFQLPVSDLSCTFTASSTSVVGQDGKGKGHGVPCGEAVWFPGALAHHLLFRCPVPQRWAALPLTGVLGKRAGRHEALLRVFPAESTLRRRRARPQASLTATHSSTLAEEVVALLRTLHSLGQWNGLINKYINSQLHSVTAGCAGKPAEGVGAALPFHSC